MNKAEAKALITEKVAAVEALLKEIDTLAVSHKIPVTIQAGEDEDSDLVHSGATLVHSGYGWRGYSWDSSGCSW